MHLLQLLRHGICKSLRHLHSLHAIATTSGLASFHPSLTFTSLLYAFTNLSSSSSAAAADYPLSLFRRIPQPSTFPHNLLIRAHTLLSSPLQALLLFARMRRLSIPPDRHTFPFVLKACAHLPPKPAAAALPLGRALHSQALKFGFSDDLFVRNTLMSVYAASASALDARTLFDESPLCCDVVTYNTMMDAHIKSRNIVSARKVFDEMQQRDAVSWGTLLAGYSQMSQFEETVKLFNEMLATGARPDDVALVSTLSCCAQLGALDQGKAIHDYIKLNRAKLNVYLSTGLVDMYAKCGCINMAREIFESTSRKNLFTWNAIIVGLAMHGHGELSLEYFNRMRNARVSPDGVTFLGVLVACSHAGFVEMAQILFNEMENVYGVKHELKHYGCMADLLGRAGRIEELMKMIEAMPMNGDSYVWGGVLAGCRVSGNVEVAEVAAHFLLELNPEDSGIYSIMASIYASSRKWEDVDKMRNMMGDRGVKKNVGCSSIEVDGFCPRSD